MDKLCKIIIADDHGLFRDGLRLLIEQEKIGKVIGEANNGQELFNLIDSHIPDLVIMDIDMPVMNGIEATEKVIKRHPDLNILILSMHGDQHHYNQLINVGAKGFVLKSSGKKELEEAIKSVSKGGSHFSVELLRKIILDTNNPQRKESSIIIDLNLTEKELEVLKYFCNGYSVSEIAEKMFLSVKSIEAYRSKLLLKTGVKNTISLVLFAIKNKIVTI